MTEYLKTIPITMLLSALTILAFMFPDAASWLDYNTHSSPIEQLAEVFGCHLLHWTGEHLFWDLGMFVLLSAICERINRRAFAVVLFFSAVLIPPAVGICHPTVETYRGLSGIDTAMFGMSVVHFVVEKLRERDRAGVILYSGLLFGMLVKITHELVTGSAIFVGTSIFSPVPIAHVVGAGLGIIAGLTSYPAAWWPSWFELPRHGRAENLV